MDRSGYAVCLNAKTGQEVFRERLTSRNRTEILCLAGFC